MECETSIHFRNGKWKYLRTKLTSLKHTARTLETYLGHTFLFSFLFFWDCYWKLSKYELQGSDQILIDLIKVECETLILRLLYLFIVFGIGRNCLSSELLICKKGNTMDVAVIKAYHCFQPHTKFYPIYIYINKIIRDHECWFWRKQGLQLTLHHLLVDFKKSSIQSKEKYCTVFNLTSVHPRN
jgi:hypothetical protein